MKYEPPHVFEAMSCECLHPSFKPFIHNGWGRGAKERRIKSTYQSFYLSTFLNFETNYNIEGISMIQKYDRQEPSHGIKIILSKFNPYSKGLTFFSNLIIVECAPWHEARNMT